MPPRRKKRTVKQRGGNVAPPIKPQVMRLVDPPTKKTPPQLMGEALIRKTYENPATGLMSAVKLVKNLKRIDPSITLKQVKAVLIREESVQFISEKRKPGFN